MTDGLILNRYRPISEAGSGGFGTVQLAWDTRIQRRVAIKCMSVEDPAMASGADGVAYDAAAVPGLEEARTAAMLSDSNIVGVIDFEVQADTAYLIMEYVDGMTLSRLLAEHNQDITADIVAAVFQAVSHALEIAHENQVLHLDIKPDNVMINRQGQVKVTDFGLAKLSSANGFSQAGGGTIGYMPPEQMRLEPLDERCDEWALAALTYEMIAGENPFLADDIPHALDAIDDAELVLPSLCIPELDEQADDVLFYALDPDRAERYDSVRDFAEELQPLLGDAAQGVKQLAVIVGHACEDLGEVDEPPAQVPRFERVAPRTRHALMRVWSAASSGVLGFAALANVSWIEGVESLVFWGVLALIVLAAVLVPHLGALLAAVAFGAALISHGAVAPGILLIVAACAWWFFSGRHGKAHAVAALAPALFGSFGCGHVAPLLGGYLLGTRDAAITAAFSGMLAVMLGAMGSHALAGWNAMLFWQNVTSGYTASLLQMLQQPGTWITWGCWVLSAVILAAFCRGGRRGVACLGALLAGAVLVAGVCASAWFASGMASWMPDAVDLAFALVPIAAVCALTLAGVPEREYCEEDADEDDEGPRR